MHSFQIEMILQGGKKDGKKYNARLVLIGPALHKILILYINRLNSINVKFSVITIPSKICFSKLTRHRKHASCSIKINQDLVI